MKKLTTEHDPMLTEKWIVWNEDQTRIVAKARTRAEAKEAARQAGVSEPILENTEHSRRQLSDLYEGGEEACQELLRSEGELLSAGALARLIGISADEVQERRASGRLIGFPQNKGHVYPSWQFTDQGTLAGPEDVLSDLHQHNRHPPAAFRFFLSPNPSLDHKTPLSRLRGGGIDEVRRAARDYGEHGAG